MRSNLRTRFRRRGPGAAPPPARGGAPWPLVSRACQALAALVGRWLVHAHWLIAWLRAACLLALALLALYVWLLVPAGRRWLAGKRTYLALWRHTPRAALARSRQAAIRLATAVWAGASATLRRADAWLQAHSEQALAWAGRISRRLVALVRDASLGAPMTLDELSGEEAEADTPLVWEQRLSPRRRLARLGVIGGTLCLTLFFITGGPATALAEWRQVAIALTPARPPAPLPPHLNASYWVAGRLPSSAIYAHGIQLQPSPADSQVAYACWIAHSGQISHPTTLDLYATADGARNWIPLAAPPAPVAACHLVADTLDSRSLLLEIVPPTTGACVPPRVFASADRGATWQPVAQPPAFAPSCDPTFVLAHGVLYLWSPSAQSQLMDSPAAQLLVSADDGANWQQAFDTADRQAGTVENFVTAGAGGSLVVVARPAFTSGRTGGGQQSTLWCRPAGGASWQSLGALPSQTSAAYVVHDARAVTGCAFTTIYAAGFLARDNTAVTRIEVRAGGVWRLVPPLAPDGTVDFPLGDDGDILGVGPNGMLLADTPYTGADVGLTAGGTVPARALWGWEPQTGAWLPDFHPTPSNTSIEGFAWDYSAQPTSPRLICWIYTLNAGVPGFTGVLRASFAAASAPAQDAYTGTGQAQGP